MIVLSSDNLSNDSNDNESNDGNNSDDGYDDPEFAAAMFIARLRLLGAMHRAQGLAGLVKEVQVGADFRWFKVRFNAGKIKDCEALLITF